MEHGTSKEMGNENVQVITNHTCNTLLSVAIIGRKTCVEGYAVVLYLWHVMAMNGNGLVTCFNIEC